MLCGAETFLDIGSHPLVLTDGIPSLLSWGAAGAEELTAARVTHTLAQRVSTAPPWGEGELREVVFRTISSYIKSERM